MQGKSRHLSSRLRVRPPGPPTPGGPVRTDTFSRDSCRTEIGVSGLWGKMDFGVSGWGREEGFYGVFCLSRRYLYGSVLKSDIPYTLMVVVGRLRFVYLRLVPETEEKDSTSLTCLWRSSTLKSFPGGKGFLSREWTIDDRRRSIGELTLFSKLKGLSVSLLYYYSYCR